MSFTCELSSFILIFINLRKMGKMSVDFSCGHKIDLGGKFVAIRIKLPHGN